MCPDILFLCEVHYKIVMKKKKISILGSTGSIGRNCLDVVRNSGGRFKIVSLSAGSNVKLLAAQIKEFNPRVAVIGNASKVGELKKLVPRSVKVTGGMEGLCGIASGRDVDIFVSALVGSAGLLPTIEAVKTGKRVALANKESLVMAGEFVMKLARKKGTEILPVDSEHSAVFQCISANRKETVRKITLTASGGPFLKTGISQMKNMTPSKALKHPRWKMGAKVTIDSATLMNKALEVIEAKWLFDVPSHMIDVVIHPESIVHSFVEFVDRSTIAQMSIPDMRIPIQYALTYPERVANHVRHLDMARIGKLTFEKPDMKKFPVLKLVYEVLNKGGVLPAVMSSSNEVAVNSYLKGRIKLTDIFKVVSRAVKARKDIKAKCIDDIFKADKWAVNYSEDLINRKVF